MAVIPSALQPYADQPRWVVWRLEKPTKGDKPTKVPYQAKAPTQKASTSNPSTWADAATAIKAAEAGISTALEFVCSTATWLCLMLTTVAIRIPAR